MTKKTVRQRLFNEQFGYCAYCFNKMTMKVGKKNTCTRDHVIPRSAGGSNSSDNLVGVCSDCNNDKADMSLTQFFLKRALKKRNIQRNVPHSNFP